MPAEQMNRAQLIQLVLLILVVPFQYLLTHGSNEISRQYEIKKVIASLADFTHSYLNWTVWLEWCGNVWSRLNSGDAPKAPDEALQAHEQNGNFATSREPRSPRSPAVKWRVGQVVRHKLWGYRGVIIGWDEQGSAPASWFDQVHPADKKRWRELPNYAVLVDTRDRLTAQMTYVPEENMQVLANTRIFHPMIDKYFEHFDGAQYLMRPWLKKIYPHD